MDDNRFDGMAKRLGALRSRRGALGCLAAVGTSGVVGLFGADAKSKGKGNGKGKNKGNKPRCKAKSKPTCSQSACQTAVCDRRRGKWSCRNTCAGTSKPKCLGGQCVDACDEDLGLTECGDQCCNPLVHSECCQGKCCAIGQRCDDGVCVEAVCDERATCCACVMWDDASTGPPDEFTWCRTDFTDVDDCHDACDGPAESLSSFKDSVDFPGRTPICGANNQCQLIACEPGG